MPHDYQRLNNCGPVTINMVLGYYGTSLSQKYTAGKIRPHPDDVSVVAIEMVTFAQVEYGYGGLVGFGGNMRLVEALVSAGVPVIVVQPMEPGSDINHFRVVRGYDRARRTVTINDSYYGPNLVWTYDYFTSLWEKRNNSYALVYPERQDTLVRAIIEKYAGEAQRRDPADLERAQRDVERAPNDPWAWLQLGQRLYYRGQPDKALKAWQRARGLGLPEKALWYTVWPVSLLNDLGRSQQALSLANEALVGSPANSELYYERARAYDAMGSSAQARRSLQLALEYAPYHPRYRQAVAYYRENGKMQVDG